MRGVLLLVGMIALAGPAVGQTMDHSTMPGMKTPAPKPPAPPADPSCPPEHAAMGHCTPAAPSGDHTAPPPGNAPAPIAPAPTYADRVWGAAAMQESRETLRREHGGGTFSQMMVDIAELQIRDGRDGFRWEGEGWFGGDIDRLVVKTEGEGSFGQRLDDAEVQALYSRAIGPYFNLQGGVRQDIRPTPSRTYAAIGVEGLAPYWFEVEAHAFVSTKGDLLGRLAASYDQRITQRLILQPRAELNFAAQDGAGLSDAELDLRLRYEIKREFAPYIGVSWASADGEDRDGLNLVFGVRAWF
ncbi:copper resistance protein B [Sphingomonas sp. SUN019]|uniref:copper resistance protein B n=1 Tax=Sphingomonas sp. SUN019 TaxID=2937788 RepID=UPI002164411C|nr:copper resistance protein B [Sphingomonas sp. SUN019]UVO49601.1 copper resistance protein B [Sphingomonas sp. SUN019]